MKTGIGNAFNLSSSVSFTLSHGIINEVFFPKEDLACIRDMGLIVTNGQDLFSEERRHTYHQTRMIEEGVPCYAVQNTCKNGLYLIEKEVLTDSVRDSLVQHIRFQVLKPEHGPYQLYVLLAPHIANRGYGNTAWLGEYKGVHMLFAERAGIALALVCSANWLQRSVGFVGVSDGWQDLSRHKQLLWEYQRAENGNVALVGRLDLAVAQEGITMALGFGRSAMEAAHQAWASIQDGFVTLRQRYVQEWLLWQNSLTLCMGKGEKPGKMLRSSAAILAMHESKRFPGGIIASMSIPWGNTRGDDNIGGYHLVWPRDLVHASSGLLALGSEEDALRVLTYLMATQEREGHWAQNMWLEGVAYWQGVQMDQVALPILLMDLCRRMKCLRKENLPRYWRTVKKAANYLIKQGPFSPQDRWEELSGYAPYTLATQVAALYTSAEYAREHKEPEFAELCLQTADFWNDNIERWTYVTGTPLAKQVGVEGYYIRINPFDRSADELGTRLMHIKNQPEAKSYISIREHVSVDALALVRFGLRAPDDPRIKNTIRVIDALLRYESPYGPCWYRYNGDGYGEKADGSAYDGTGIGRPWPLLVGERAHYELAAGNRDEAIRLLKVMEAFASHDLFPEQIWDAKDMPEKELYAGRPTGSARPLVWAHAEYVKLCRSLQDGKLFDLPILPHTRNNNHS